MLTSVKFKCFFVFVFNQRIAVEQRVSRLLGRFTEVFPLIISLRRTKALLEKLHANILFNKAICLFLYLFCDGNKIKYFYFKKILLMASEPLRELDMFCHTMWTIVSPPH